MFSENTFDGFVSRLREHESQISTKYVLGKSPKSFNVAKVSPTSKQKIYWRDDIPYFHFGSRYYYCHQGRDLNLSKKNKYAEEIDKKAAMDHSYIKRYNKTQGTKKLGCPAKILVSRVIRIPEHKLNGSHSRRYEQMKVVKIIREKIENGELFGEEVFIFNLPDISTHSNHIIGESAPVAEPVDSRVQEYVNHMVDRGERNALVISKLLKTYVKNELQEHNRFKRRFFPKMATIRSMISSANSKGPKEPVDQENSDSSSIFEEALPEYQEVPLKDITKRHLLNECNAEMRSLQSVLCFLGDSDLESVKNALKDIHRIVSSKFVIVKNNEICNEIIIDS